MASKIGKALGYPMTSEESDMDELEEVGEPKAKKGKGEVLAMKAFMAADTAEAKAEAMKTFIELCGGY